MLSRLKRLEENLNILKSFSEISVEDLKQDKTKEWAIRYGFYESIQIVIDIACHLVSKYNLGAPQSYSECIELLERYKYIPSELAEKLIKMIGLRNLLAHEYAIIKPEKLLLYLKELQDFEDFINCVVEYL